MPWLAALAVVVVLGACSSDGSSAAEADAAFCRALNRLGTLANARIGTDVGEAGARASDEEILQAMGEVHQTGMKAQDPVLRSIAENADEKAAFPQLIFRNSEKDLAHLTVRCKKVGVPLRHPFDDEDAEGISVVPDVVGLSLVEAITAMRDAGLAVEGTGAYERDPQSPDAIVMASIPSAGEQVPAGSFVGFRTCIPDSPCEFGPVPTTPKS